jgi:hypothetical protein
MVLLQSLIQGILDSLPALLDMLPTIITAIVNFLTENLPLIMSMGIEILFMLIDGILQAIPDLVKAIPEIVTAIYEGLAKVPDMLWDIGTNLIDKLWEGMKKQKNSLWNSIREMFSNIGTSIKAFFTDTLPEVGGNLVEGIWNGIKDKAQWIKDKLKEFSSSVVDNIKDFFGIKSPSTVLRDQVGKYMAEGVGVGFVDEMGAVTKDIENSLPTKFDITPKLDTSGWNNSIGSLNSLMTSTPLAKPEFNFNQSQNVQITVLDKKFDMMITLLQGIYDKSDKEIVLDPNIMSSRLAPLMNTDLAKIGELQARV